MGCGSVRTTTDEFHNHSDDSLPRGWKAGGELVGEFEMSLRVLQRLLREYVGISSKWIIQCYRLLDAACGWPQVGVGHSQR